MSAASVDRADRRGNGLGIHVAVCYAHNLVQPSRAWSRWVMRITVRRWYKKAKADFAALTDDCSALSTAIGRKWLMAVFTLDDVLAFA